MSPAGTGTQEQESVGIEMTLADLWRRALGTTARCKACGVALLPALSLAGLLTLTLPLSEAAGAAPASATNAADEDGADADVVSPIFGLPPIVVTVLENSDPTAKTLIFMAVLVFDEVDAVRIEDSLSVTKSLLPRIMDSVITGIQGKRFDDLANLAALNDIILQRSNAVLTPYGVVVKSLRLRNLSRP